MYTRNKGIAKVTKIDIIIIKCDKGKCARRDNKLEHTNAALSEVNLEEMPSFLIQWSKV